MEIAGNVSPSKMAGDVRIESIDLLHGGVPGAIASWVVEGPSGWVLIESGPASTGQILDEGLAKLGIDPASLSAVLLTHIHLDHSGGAWRFAEREVPVYVHPIGRPHLVDPTKLERSARRIFGDRFDALWGPMHACSEEMVHSVAGGESIEAGGLHFVAVETPGHAMHHHAWHLQGSTSIFTGDAAAMRVPGTDWITIPMPPPEFDLGAWERTMDLLESGPWSRFYLTHGGVVEDVAKHLGQLRASLMMQVDWVLRHGSDSGAVQSYRAWLREQSHAWGVSEELFSAHVSKGLLEMNLAGVSRWGGRQPDMSSQPSSGA